MFKFFKSKKKPGPIYKKYNVGKTIVTILDMNNHEYISTFEGYVTTEIDVSTDFFNCKIFNYNNLITANEYFDWYLNEVYSNRRLFELDNGNFIPEHRIKLIKPSEETELWKEYIVPFNSDKYEQQFCNHRFKYKAMCGNSNTCETCSKCYLHKLCLGE